MEKDELKDFRNYLSRLASRIKLLGKPKDLLENVINIESFFNPRKTYAQRVTLGVLDSKILYEKSSSCDRLITNSDFIKFLEVQTAHIISSVINKKNIEDLLQKKDSAIKSLCSDNSFNLHFKYSRPEVIDTLHKFVEFIASVSYKSDDIINISNKIPIGTSWSTSYLDESATVNLPIPREAETSLRYEFNSIDHFLDFSSKLTSGIDNNAFLVLKFDCFLYEGPYSTVTLKVRCPFIWGSNLMHLQTYKILMGEFSDYLDSRFLQVYKPFLSDLQNTSSSFLVDISDKNIVDEVKTIMFYQGIKSEKRCFVPKPLDYYESLNYLCDYFKIPIDSKESKSLSVCICTRNRASLLDNMLKTLVAQTSCPDEVLIIDNDSTDNTTEIIDSYRAKLPLRSITSRLRTISALRDLCVHEAKGDIITFTDDDVLLNEKWIQKIRKTFNVDPQLDLLGGKVKHWRQDSNNASELFHRYYLG